MRCLGLLKADEETEAGVPPSPELMARMGEFMEEISRAGVLLATVPGILRNAPGKCDWWRFTSWSARRLAEEAFPGGTVGVETFGNVLATTGFLYGLGQRDFDRATLEVSDPAFELLIGIRARKASGEAS